MLLKGWANVDKRASYLGAFLVVCLGAGVASAQVAQPSPTHLPPPEALPVPAATFDEISLQLPDPERLFQPESEATTLARIRAAALEKNIKNLPFPVDPPLVGRLHPGTLCGPPLAAVQWSVRVCHGPLYFENRALETGAGYSPAWQMFYAPAAFFGNAFLLPVHAALRPPWTRQCSPR